jgi:hypothetical protein
VRVLRSCSVAPPGFPNDLAYVAPCRDYPEMMSLLPDLFEHVRRLKIGNDVWPACLLFALVACNVIVGMWLVLAGSVLGGAGKGAESHPTLVRLCCAARELPQACVWVSSHVFPSAQRPCARQELEVVPGVSRVVIAACVLAPHACPTTPPSVASGVLGPL